MLGKFFVGPLFKMIWPSRRWLPLLATLGVVAIMVAGAFVFRGPGDPGVTPSATPTCPPGVLCVTADKIVLDYATDFDAAQATYQGNAVELSGIVGDAVRNNTGYYTALMEVNTSGTGPDVTVGCRDLPPMDVSTWQGLHPNDWNVTLTGKVVAGTTLGGITIALTGCHIKPR